MSARIIDARRVAILRELAALGVNAKNVSRLVGVTDAVVSQWRKRFGIDFPRGPLGSQRDERLHRIIEEGYAQGVSPRVLALAAGTSVKTIHVIAHRKGLTDKGRDNARFRRGFAVPPELREKYRELRTLGLTMKESGYALGLLERPQPEAAE